MKVAIKHVPLSVDAEGHVVGYDAGDTLARRLLRLFAGAQLISEKPGHYHDFEVVTLDMVDAENTVVVNMDVIDSVDLWRQLKAKTSDPKIMNFVWWDSTRYETPVETAELALSCAMFPTFANSERTQRSVAESVHRWVVKPLAELARISGVNLGIRLELVQPRKEPPVPVVLYPAIYVSSRKQPDLFIDIVSKVAKRTPIIVEARLSKGHLVSEPAMRLSRERWAKVGPLIHSREDYWKALASTTAFLATALEESYGLEYVEAMISGAVGIFPKKDWARSLLPEGYPFFYKTPAEAELLLYRAIMDTDACRAELDKAAGGSFVDWLRDHHDDDNFETAVAKQIEAWFGPVEVAALAKGTDSLPIGAGI